MYHQVIIFVLIVIANIQCAAVQDSTLIGTKNIWPDITALDNLSQPIVKFTQFNTITFLITKDDWVYVYGERFTEQSEGLLGLGKDVKSVTRPTEIVEFRGKKIFKLCAGYEYMLALSMNGEVWSWGKNTRGELGIGIEDSCYRPVGVNISSFVTDIQCGYYDSYALTDEQEIVAWGYNRNGELGTGATLRYLKPVKVDLENVTSVVPSTYPDMVIALTSNGQVHRWGEGATSSPALLSLNEKVVQIAASADFCFMLTEDGVVDYIQVGSSQKSIDTPYRFKSIYTDRVPKTHKNIIVGITIDGEIYGSNGDINQSFDFEKMNVTEIADAFTLLSSEIWLSFMVSFEDETMSTTTETNNGHGSELLVKMFNNPNFSDFEFYISNQTIFVDHRILVASSTWMGKQFSGQWFGVSSVSIDNYSYRTYYLYLYYLYTDRLDITLDEALDLDDLAMNQHEDNLKERCRKIIHSES